MNNTTQCSNNIAPDIIEKVAIDPGWGHYEALALQRWFTDKYPTRCRWRCSCGHSLEPEDDLRLGRRRQRLGAGMAEIRRPAGQRAVRPGHRPLRLGPTGRRGHRTELVTLSPITEVEFLVGGVAHPWTGSDWYVYYGQEQTQRNAWTVGATQGGWGNLAFPESGCAAAGLPVANFDGTAGSTNFNGSSGTCTANVQRIQMITVGFWQDFYKGDLGRMRYGLNMNGSSWICSTAQAPSPAACTRTTTSCSSRSATIRSTKRA